jgi:hypothetical protein
LVVNDRSAVVGIMIYVTVFDFPVRVEKDIKVMEHFPFGNIGVCPATRKWLMDRSESRKVTVWSALTW